MANKITQLVNKDGDNLYPLAGGILSDSVATDMIQDGAVTSDKIDSATLYPLIQSGTHNLNSAAWETIQFPHPFSTTPHVIATLNTQNAETATATWCKVANVSTTGFRAAVGTANGYGTGQVDWVATIL